MTLAIIRTRAGLGLEAPEVLVEVHLANGLPGITLVGLPETAVKESRERVRSALVNAGFEFPLRRITLNLAPADLPKDGGRFDLPIALGLLVASGQIPPEALAEVECVGELALDGGLRPASGVLPLAMATRQAGRRLIVPRANADEAALAGDLEVLPAEHLLEVVAHLLGQEPIAAHRLQAPPRCDTADPDLREVRGQHQARRALEIAAAGGHNLLFAGPPGTGKTMLASRLPGILPPLGEDEALEVAAVRSVSGLPLAEQWGRRPFRTPHHTASAVALVGGGSRPKPGEISLAHHGVLFLDELPEFSRQVLEVMREPMESGQIHIARANHERRYPARFQLVAAMNPCPCGHLGDPRQACHCTAAQIQRYQARLSGPLLDRIDLQVEVPALPAEQLTSRESGEDSATVRERVLAARERQWSRGALNAYLAGPDLEAACALGADDRAWLAEVLERLQLSARAFHRVLRVALTLADLAGAPKPGRDHLIEAIGYRQLDRLLKGS
ncbi:YifB family Mg chelatase-like AAA ATPase [Halomonas eurihalina]|uniref:YifB family Mg chelatase-like AAA ATPase n=1 Tax=Halomonas eurihalina TaxID=42566 RepID=A0A5D9CUT2_HALER|nr:YifB family Mg chelatase-like AAA ATPase [Halomonas eurihalina]MDR5861018.1 YifB family Mg chelatase-like AAA ATPase [Halomonas eurihalina]TZG35658.1 YifB family Mg chelatase-like AAA ATPase [Halomonas eurihalina]